MKYSVLLVDDERIIREGIAGSLPWEELGFVLDGMAADGREALEYLRGRPVDVAIIDIKMPVLNGFQLVEQARQEGIATEFIILSGYDDFEYAQKAMQYGVKHFLLKPTEPLEIINALTAARELISKRRETDSLLKRYEENSRKLQALMKEQFLRDCILGRAYSVAEKAYYRELLDMGEKSFSAIAVRADTGGDRSRIFLVRSIAEEYLGDSLFLSAIVHELVYFAVNAMTAQALLQCTQELVGRLKASGFPSVTASFAEHWDIMSPGTVSNELEACIRFRFWVPDAEVITREDMDFPESGLLPIAFDSQPLLNCLQCGDFEAAQGELDGFFRLLQQQSSIETAKFYSIRLCLELLERHRGEVGSYLDGVGAIQSMDSLLEVQAYITSLAQRVAEESRSQLAQKSNRKIDKMLACIEENITNEDFSLKWLSENLLYFNTDYLGKLFKKEMGISFTNYVVKRRIELACELFRSNPQNHVYDVAAQTGFGDNTQYFSQVFKKVTGVLPSEFQKSL